MSIKNLTSIKHVWPLLQRCEIQIAKSLKIDSFLDFIIIGFPKCGTTALIQNLLKHPQIFGIQGENEPRFFLSKNKSLLNYIRQFNPKMINGEKASIYVLNNDAMNRIYQLLANIKIIICVREPIQAMHSFYDYRRKSSFYGQLYGDSQGKISFEDLVLNDLKHEYFSNETFCYFKHIKENVLPYFDKRNIHIVIQEQMAIDTDGQMKRLFEFLDLPCFKTDWINFKNQNDQGRYPTIDYGSSKYPSIIEKLHSLYKPYNEDLFNFLGHSIDSWNALK